VLVELTNDFEFGIRIQDSERAKYDPLGTQIRNKASGAVGDLA